MPHDQEGEPRMHDRGATAAEYAIIASLIAAVIVVSVTLLGTAVNDLFQPAATFFGG